MRTATLPVWDSATKSWINKEIKIHGHKVSNCCSASPRNFLDEEGEICGECGEHCVYEEEV